MDKQTEAGRVKRTQRDYSLAFKLQVIEEVEKGERTYKEVQRKYGIQGRSTVLVWLRKHGKLNWGKLSSMTDNQIPRQKIKELEKQIERLENEKLILNKTIDLASEAFGVDIRKKCLPLLSRTSNQQGKIESPSS
jgi:transposase